ncbi:hypothetical protein Y032_0040g284 [Ancylostoma ceylanicum]|uniref:Uncharacterized protein n=1 Tax=Ancylostoma ceylanicum TaxID=53326 RepID=A0A016UI83_9BILA|nr:hypothetical protein Y032_0040g284 [Ancylostoma ceylanicum]
MKLIFTVDDKWCLYVNTKRSTPWIDKDEQHEPQPKAGLHPLKVVINAWCDCKGVTHCEVLPRHTAHGGPHLMVDLCC